MICVAQHIKWTKWKRIIFTHWFHFIFFDAIAQWLRVCVCARVFCGWWRQASTSLYFIFVLSGFCEIDECEYRIETKPKRTRSIDAILIPSQRHERGDTFATVELRQNMVNVNNGAMLIMMMMIWQVGLSKLPTHSAWISLHITQFLSHTPKKKCCFHFHLCSSIVCR